MGVGFSTADDPAVYGQNDDDSTASDNLRAVEAFFSAKFPELRGNPFYITGESYAGPGQRHAMPFVGSLSELFFKACARVWC